MTVKPVPITLQTVRGDVEHAAAGEGPAVLALHGESVAGIIP